MSTELKRDAKKYTLDKLLGEWPKNDVGRITYHFIEMSSRHDRFGRRLSPLEAPTRSNRPYFNFGQTSSIQLQMGTEGGEPQDGCRLDGRDRFPSAKISGMAWAILDAYCFLLQPGKCKCNSLTLSVHSTKSFGSEASCLGVCGNDGGLPRTRPGPLLRRGAGIGRPEARTPGSVRQARSQEEFSPLHDPRMRREARAKLAKKTHRQCRCHRGFRRETHALVPDDWIYIGPSH